MCTSCGKKYRPSATTPTASKRQQVEGGNTPSMTTPLPKMPSPIITRRDGGYPVSGHRTPKT